MTRYYYFLGAGIGVSIRTLTNKEIPTPPSVTCNTHLLHEQSLPLVSPSLKLNNSIGINLCCCTQQLTRGAFEGGSGGSSGNGQPLRQASESMGSGDEHRWLRVVVTSIGGNRQRQLPAAAATGSGGNQQQRRRGPVAMDIDGNGHRQHHSCDSTMQSSKV